MQALRNLLILCLFYLVLFPFILSSFVQPLLDLHTKTFLSSPNERKTLSWSSIKIDILMYVSIESIKSSISFVLSKPYANRISMSRSRQTAYLRMETIWMKRNDYKPQTAPSTHIWFELIEVCARAWIRLRLANRLRCDVCYLQRYTCMCLRQHKREKKKP